jgi:tetratricopeptide (TPR) repeat protein
MNYRKYLSYEPNADAELELGTVFYMLGNFDSADVHYKRVLAIDPKNANAAHNIGAIYLNQKNFPQAINYFKQTIAIAPNHMNAYSNLSHAYFFSGQYQLAIQTIQQAFQMDKNPRDVPYIALAYQKMGNMAEAKRWETISKQYYSQFKLE